MTWPSPQIIVFAAAGSFGAARWALNRWRSRNIERVFIRDMATNHLPHIYSALEQIAQSMGVHLEEPPQIKFISEEEFKSHHEG